MRRYKVCSSRFAIGTLAALLILAARAQAGPPLICHVIDIGQAKSLPWSGEGWSLSEGQNYNLKNLVADTLAILDSNTPVLVRMETLRRATIYARQDPQAAKELLTRLYSRAQNSDTAGRPDALAWFDVGYLTECYKQWLGRNLPHMTDGLPMSPNPAANLDGYAWVKRAIGLRGQDPEMELAAALITLEGPEGDRQEHVQKAMAGAKGDPLLAQNLASHFVGNRGETISDVLVKVTTAKN
ncbi:MAG TPA: hypothetical protein VI455_20765 [Terriglobia bacterium]